jgi:hypothetical protein
VSLAVGCADATVDRHSESVKAAISLIAADPTRRALEWLRRSSSF